VIWVRTIILGAVAGLGLLIVIGAVLTDWPSDTSYQGTIEEDKSQTCANPPTPEPGWDLLACSDGSTDFIPARHREAENPAPTPQSCQDLIDQFHSLATAYPGDPGVGGFIEC
jgi:hypothetical protein